MPWQEDRGGGDRKPKSVVKPRNNSKWPKEQRIHTQLNNNYNNTITLNTIKENTIGVNRCE
jgi:hypothetical protein